MPFLIPAADDPNAGYLALVDAALDPVDGFLAKRERVDEYGWRNFGDLYADHESAFQPPDRAVRLALQQPVRRASPASRCSSCAPATRAGGG